jgi:hypothetical protein
MEKKITERQIMKEKDSREKENEGKGKKRKKENKNNVKQRGTKIPR